MVEVDSQLISGEGDRCAFDMDVDGDLFGFVIFDAYEQIISEPTACIVKHSNQYLLTLLLVQITGGRLTQYADSFVIA